MSDETTSRRAALAAALSATDQDVRRRALRELTGLSPDAAARLVDDAVARALLVPLASQSRTEQREAADAVAPLVTLCPLLHDLLRAALHDENARLRWGAAYTLGRALPADRELWPAARETLALDDGDQRWAAAELSCAIARRDTSVRAELRGALADASPTLRKMVLYCLRDLDDPNAAADARALLDDPDAGVRLAALATLARCAAPRDGKPTPPRDTSDAAGDAAAVARLLDGDPDAGVRRAAAATLGKLARTESEVLTALRRAAAASDASLARAAQASLRALEATI